MKRIIVLLVGALALVSLGSGATAEAQSVEHFKSSPTRLTGYFILQACCEGNVIDRDEDVLDLGYDFDLDPAFGFGFRAERRLADFMALGGMLEFVAWEADADDDREFFFDVDIFAKVLHEIELSGSMALEVYALLPFGFTAGFVDDEGGDDELRGFGLNTGILAGAMLIFDKVGILVELGARHRSVWDEVEGRDFRLGVTQFTMNFGASVAF